MNYIVDKKIISCLGIKLQNVNFRLKLLSERFFKQHVAIVDL